MGRAAILVVQWVRVCRLVQAHYRHSNAHREILSHPCEAFLFYLQPISLFYLDSDTHGRDGHRVEGMNVHELGPL